MMNNNLFLRRVIEPDKDLLYEWANDDMTRRNAFNTEHISYDEHKAWFARMMDDDDQIQYILMNNEIPIGQVRFIIQGSVAEMDYSIVNSERKKGYGNELIRLARERIMEDNPEIRSLVGKVKPDNKASSACFENNGFVEKYRYYEYCVVGED